MEIVKKITCTTRHRNYYFLFQIPGAAVLIIITDTRYPVEIVVLLDFLLRIRAGPSHRIDVRMNYTHSDDDSEPAVSIFIIILTHNLLSITKYIHMHTYIRVNEMYKRACP